MKNVLTLPIDKIQIYAVKESNSIGFKKRIEMRYEVFDGALSITMKNKYDITNTNHLNAKYVTWYSQ